MRARVLTGERAVVLAGPTVLAFFSGGYFDEPRLIAGGVAWLLCGLVAFTAPVPLPRTLAPRLALAGLALLAAWVLLSVTWAPLRGPAYHDGERVMLYLGVLLAATALFREPRALRAVDPALAAGALVVIGYGLSERFLPGLLTFAHTASAGGRLDQPLTYWNATGLLAALGLILCARLAGDTDRRELTRVLAAAGTAPLGLGVYLSFSRGALLAVAVGGLVLLAAAPTWSQLRAQGIALQAGALASLGAAGFHGVTRLAGSLSDREAGGIVALAVMAGVMLGAAALQGWACSEERRDRVRMGRLPLPRHTPLIAAGLIVVALGAFVAVAAKERGGQEHQGATVARFGTLQSNRYAYWRVAAHTFADHPIKGVGSSGFRVEWLRHRHINEAALDAHSLYLETAAELGLVGLAFLVLFLGGVALAGRTAVRVAGTAAAGPLAVAAAWAVHAGIDWDWEMPAVTLPALLCAGALLATADRRQRAQDDGYGVPPVAERLRRSARERGVLSTAGACIRWAAGLVVGAPLALTGGRGEFELGGERYRYVHHLHNWTWLNERGVELAVARRALEESGEGRVLEVGHVLGHYEPGTHTVVDRYEPGPEVLNEDVLDHSPALPYDLILSVSTLEHVGWDESPRDPDRAVLAIARLRDMLAPGGQLLVTIPVGYNAALDAAVRDGRAGFDEVRALRRSRGRKWREVDLAQAWDAPYDDLLYSAEGVLVCRLRRSPSASAPTAANSASTVTSNPMRQLRGS